MRTHTYYYTAFGCTMSIRAMFMRWEQPNQHSAVPCAVFRTVGGRTVRIPTAELTQETLAALPKPGEPHEQ